MKKFSGKAALIVTLLLPLIACSQGSAPAAAAEDDSPEGQAFQYRTGLMHAVAWKVGKLRAMAMGEIPVDDMAAVKGARDVSALAGMMAEGFIHTAHLVRPLVVATPEEAVQAVLSAGRASEGDAAIIGRM